MIGFGPLGLFILAVLDSTGLPIVAGVDVLLIAIATEKPKEAYVAALLAVVGSLVGSLVLFFVARKGGEVLLMRHVASKTGARLHLWFQRWGLATVFVPAVVPIIPLPLKVPVFCAGALQVRVLYFASVLVAARVIRYFGIAYLAIHYGAQTFQFVKSHAWQLVFTALFLAAIMTVAMRLFQKQQAEHGVPE